MSSDEFHPLGPGPGDEGPAHQLPRIYDELRALAQQYLDRGGGPVVTLQPTALVHEAYLRLASGRATSARSESHFRAASAQAMRHVLIDHARQRGRQKRGAAWQRITLSGVEVGHSNELDLLALEEALVDFEAHDPRAAKIVELRFFGGLSDLDIGEILGIAERTVRNDLSMARAWLRIRLEGSAP